MYFEMYQQGNPLANALGGATSMLGGDWRWRLRAANGETIASGEGYRNRADCDHAICGRAK